MRHSPIRPILRLALIPYRFRIASPAFLRPFGQTVAWLVRSREHTNFTYDLTERNRLHLAWFISETTGTPPNVVSDYFGELDHDEALAAHLRDATRRNPRAIMADERARYARRVGWYAYARILKPRVSVETGIDKGLGTCVLAAALLRNASEGHPGIVYGTDINPEAGYLIGSPYADVVRILRGDSKLSLSRLDAKIDLFINDSDHSAGYEAQEYEVIRGRLAERAIIIGDNAHSSDALAEFASRTGRSFLFFREQPRDHWYGGAGIGVCFPRMNG